MAIRISIFHQTTYEYKPHTTLGPQVVRLRPAPHCRSDIVGYSLKVSPADHFINWQQDPHSNWLARLNFHEPVKHFQITVDLVADLSPTNPFDFFLEESSEFIPVTYDDKVKHDLSPYLEIDRKGLGVKFRELDKALQPKGKIKTVDHLVMMNQAVNETLNYTLRMEPGVQTPEETLKKCKGSCRDFAWLLVQLLRKQKIAARFVSGYSVQVAADKEALDGPSGVSTDVVDLHAWVEAYLPGAGWVGLDATSGMLCTEGHIPLAASPNPSNASPIEGGLTECEVEFSHKMSVTRIHEDPRVTKPFSDGEWKSVVELGDAVDDRIQKADIRMTMGGEPTFISIDDYEAEEWNTGAVGQDKYERCIHLTKRLRGHQLEGSLIHCGQGKWYPGESLPRWAMALYWRKDGHPIWTQDKYCVMPNANLGHTAHDARTFISVLTHHLGVESNHVTPAYEDPLYYIWKEGRLPKDVDAIDNKLENEEDRDRMRQVFSRGLGHPVGYVLPIQKHVNPKGKFAWQSGLWLLRGQQKDERKIYLIPGDSPLGLRLPLASLDTVSVDPFLYPTDPTDPNLAELPKTEQLHQAVRYDEPSQFVADQEQFSRSVSGPPIRTAMTCQPRNGVLHIFMPPVRTLEDYLEIVAAIEATCVECDLPIVIEGYTPPVDPRIEVLKVTPDPGVIEINIAPASNWREMIHSTQSLYEDARQCRLGTEKFMVDGRHVGTGGGNHMVIGAATPLDSPFIRRPDLLRSVIAYWNNHPSLSYLFSGMFVGPTCQAPRVDEGRVDSIEELELAMMQFNCFSQPEPWMVDRWFRNLLVDLTGNTHRSEICIDKLYSPDSPTGRLGLVEFRGFEMPPHAEMSLVQQLLLRSIILMFWERPYTEKLIRWGSRLHDQYLLPYHNVNDFSKILYDLRLSGIPFKESWFDSHMEFRFPIAGKVSINNIEIELRHGIEPWNVLGEEPGSGGTARCVDSSLERLQISVKGIDFDPTRHGISVNGIQLPLVSIDDNQSFIGLKFRAWQPPHCLHPSIPAHVPLVFDLVDLQENKALGGCSYHPSHPGGAAYEDRPINALSAEARRKERFVPFGHTPGTVNLQQVPLKFRNKHTIDLRHLLLS
jgi:uncharacterized protein (DUF2126 family)/transglutaminase-like putative cysteine protease